MNLALWIAQGILAVFAVLAALLRLRDAVSSVRYIGRYSDGPLFPRDTAFLTGVFLLLGAAGLVGPALPLAALHHHWVVSAGAGLVVLVLVWLHVNYRYGDEVSVIAGAALVVVAVLRGLPFAFNQ